MQQCVKCPEQTPPLEISLKGREVQRVFSPSSTDKALEAQFLSFKVIQVSGGATGNLQSLWLSGDHPAGNFFSFSFSFWKGVGVGCLFSSPLPPFKCEHWSRPACKSLPQSQFPEKPNLSQHFRGSVPAFLFLHIFM